MKYKVWSTYPPALWRHPKGGLVVVGGTVTKLQHGKQVLGPEARLPEGTTLGQLEWQKPPRPAPVKPVTKQVRGSSGKVYILERQPSGKWSCTCPGYQYRRFCKHTGAK